MSVSWPLIGRAEEVDLLSGILATGGARGVVLSGAAGVGKTRLAGEVIRHAGAAGRVTAWAAASRALAEIPFGAFAHLLAADDVVTGSPLDVLRRAHGEIRRRSPDRPLVLGVDDAHLLDDASAGLLHQLAAAETAFVVATVREGDRTPDAVRALWKDGLAERVELRPLPGPEVGELLAAALDGQVDTATAHRLWRASEGNVLLLRELVLVGTAQGVLARRHGVWSWRGELCGSARLAELIDERLSGLAAEQRAALEVLAVGEPLPVALFERVVGAAVADSLEAAGLLGIAGDSAQLAHPLYGEAVRAELRPLRRRSVCRDLASCVTDGECDVLRLAGWQLDGGTELDADTLIAAARRAGHLGDHPLEERFARAAGAAGGGVIAGLALAASLQSQGRVVECRVELNGMDIDRAEPEERTRWAILSAMNAVWEDADAAAADAILLDVQTSLPAGDLWDELTAQRAEILCFGGRAIDALTVAEPALRRMGPTADTRLRLGRVAVLALATVGRTDQAIATADELLHCPGRDARERPLQLDMVVAARLHAFCHAGRYGELEAAAISHHDRVMSDVCDDLRGLVVFLWGRALFGRGLLGCARARLREAAALLREHDPFGMLPLMLATLARVEAHLGHADRAEVALTECEQRANPAIKIYTPYIALARAWVASVGGDPHRARAHTLRAAELAVAVQCPTVELEALHEAVRLGEPGLADRLAAVADRVDCALAADYAAHAVALGRHDGVVLDECAVRFAEAGLCLLAAEASVEAAEVYAKAGHRSAELASLDRAHRWADRCGGARTPALIRGRQAPLTSWLTAREREIAELAVHGLSNAEIADRLVLSRRTVGNHLTSVYGKLAVTSRAQLTDRLVPYVQMS